MAPPFAVDVEALEIRRSLIRQGAIRIPRGHLRAGVQGRGEYQVCVSRSGVVEEVRILAGLGAAADRDVREAILARWLFRPQRIPACFRWSVLAG